MTKTADSQQKQSLPGTIHVILITSKIQLPQLVVGGAAEDLLPELSNSSQQFVHYFQDLKCSLQFPRCPLGLQLSFYESARVTLWQDRWLRVGRVELPLLIV